MEGSINLRNKINEIIEKSKIDLNMSIQIISLKDDKVIYDLGNEWKEYNQNNLDR